MLGNNIKKQNNNLVVGRNLVDNNNNSRTKEQSFVAQGCAKFQLGGDDEPKYFLSQRLIIGTFFHHDMTNIFLFDHI
jgi:hypothetical protein